MNVISQNILKQNLYIATHKIFHQLNHHITPNKLTVSLP